MKKITKNLLENLEDPEAAEAQKIIDSFEGEAIDFNGNSEDGYSVLVKDKNSDFEAWMDYWINSSNKDLEADWNQYIFYNYSSEDLIKSKVQESIDVFMEVDSLGMNYLIDNGYLIDNEDGTYEWVKGKKSLGQLKESAQINEIIESIKSIYKEVFPKSLCSVSFGAFGGMNTVFINMYLAGEASEDPNGYLDNDLFNITLRLMTGSSDMELTDLHSSILTKPTKEYYAYGNEKIPFRKVVGNEEKILSYLKAFVKRIKETLDKLIEENRIPEDRMGLVNSKINNTITEEVESNRSILINPEDEKYYDHKYKVSLYPGSGVELVSYYVYANYEMKALEKVVAYVEKEAPGLLIDIIDIDPDLESDYIYVDGTEEGASKPYYVGPETQIEEILKEDTNAEKELQKKIQESIIEEVAPEESWLIDTDTVVFIKNGKEYTCKIVSMSQVDVYLEGKKISSGLFIEDINNELFTNFSKDDISYNLYGGAYAGKYTLEELEKLPCYTDKKSRSYEKEKEAGGTVPREILWDQPELNGYLGPMFDGYEGNKINLRYETQEVYDMLSK